MPATIALLCVSCFKTAIGENGDTKIKFHNVVEGSKAQDFSLNEKKNVLLGTTAQNTSNISFGSSTAYVVTVGNTPYELAAQNNRDVVKNATLNFTPEVGTTLSVFYTKNISGDSTLLIFKDEVKNDTAQAKFKFVNLANKLNQPVVVKDSLNTFSAELDFGSKSAYYFSNPKANNKLYFYPLGQDEAKDSIPANALSKGKVYTILFHSLTTKELSNRLISNN